MLSGDTFSACEISSVVSDLLHVSERSLQRGGKSGIRRGLVHTPYPAAHGTGREWSAPPFALWVWCLWWRFLQSPPQRLSPPLVPLVPLVAVVTVSPSATAYHTRGNL